MYFLTNGKFIVCYLFALISVDGKSHDGQSAGGPVTEGHVHASQDSQQEMLGQHGAAAAAAGDDNDDDDLAADGDGENL